MYGAYGYNPFWMQDCPAREFPNLKHMHDPHCTDGHITGQCCECGRHAKDFSQKQIPAPDPDPRYVDEDDLPVETVRDYETGARARIMVDSWPPKQGRALRFLKWRHERGDLS